MVKLLVYSIFFDTFTTNYISSLDTLAQKFSNKVLIDFLTFT